MIDLSFSRSLYGLSPILYYSTPLWHHSISLLCLSDKFLFVIFHWIVLGLDDFLRIALVCFFDKLLFVFFLFLDFCILSRDHHECSRHKYKRADCDCDCTFVVVSWISWRYFRVGARNAYTKDIDSNLHAQVSIIKDRVKVAHKLFTKDKSLISRLVSNGTNADNTRS